MIAVGVRESEDTSDREADLRVTWEAGGLSAARDDHCRARGCDDSMSSGQRRRSATASRGKPASAQEATQE